MLTIKAMAGGASYAAHHLSNNDYYSVGETITGQWVGHGAELLGLKGAVAMDQFDAVRQGIHPSTGEFLRQRQGANRFDEAGAKTATARNLYDFTISAPKAVSVQALVDPRLIEVHKLAVGETTAEMERLAATRVRKSGLNEDRTTSNLVIARYDHDTSRELDPQLHSHLVAGNLTYDGVEGRWKALQASEIYREREYLTEVYRNILAREVTTLGYRIQDRFEHGKDLGFTIVGIEESTLEKYSQRSEQRDRAIAEFLDQNGRLPSNNEIARLIRDSRPEKLAEITTAQVKAGQFARMDAGERQTLKELHRTAQSRGSLQERAAAAPSLAHAKEHVFERVSVAKHYELKTEALRHGRGRVDLPELKGVIVSEVATGAMLTAKGELATVESLDRERGMIATINKGVGHFQPLGRGREFVTSDRLRPEQKHAVETILASRDFAVDMRGAAGTGKTATLQELRRGLTEARRGVVAVAPTASAVEELQKVGFPNAMTVARLLSDPQQRHEVAGQVLIVDEAGMVSSKDMAELLELAKEKNARIVFSGDTAQIKSVSEGDALRVLERESDLKSVSLLQVQRQTNAEYKAAVEALRVNPAEGFEKLQAMGAIQEVDWRLRAQEVNLAYREAAAMPNVKGEARSVLVVAATHDELKSVTYAIREDMKRRGELSAGRTVPQHWPLNWTEAQKKQFKNYQPGQVLEFHKAVKGFRKNEALEVISASKGEITARKANGRDVTITARQAGSFAVFEKKEIEVSPGDKLLLQANWKDKAFRATNGELVSVAHVEGGSITLEDGRTLPAAYRQLSHGYAVTAHRSQGKTVDFQIIAAEQMARDLFYVSVSRGREGVKVITSDSVSLQESIGISGDRQSASELARRSKVSASQKVGADDFNLYRAQQQLANQRRPAQDQAVNIRVSQQELPTNHVNTSHVGLTI